MCPSEELTNLKNSQLIIILFEIIDCLTLISDKLFYSNSNYFIRYMHVLTLSTVYSHVILSENDLTSPDISCFMCLTAHL